MKNLAVDTNNRHITKIGSRIRKQRRLLKKTLQQLAAECGLSAGFISLIERGQTAPSLSSLANIAREINLPLSALIESPPAVRNVSHYDKRKSFSVEDGLARYERLSGVFKGSTFHVSKMCMPSGYSTELISHSGEEFIFVLEGKVRCTVNHRTYVLNRWDSLHFNAEVPHCLKAVDGDAHLVLVGTLNVFGGNDEKTEDNWDGTEG